MSKHTTLIAAALSAVLCIAATTPVSAQMYRWINDDGSTTYSNQLPMDPSTVQELTVIETPKAPPSVAVDPAPRILVEPTPAKNEMDKPSARASVRSLLPQAVQDPCLTSSDRFCHQKHKNHYRPYVGYAPYESSVAEASPAVPPARGTTNGASGSGAVSGGARTK